MTELRPAVGGRMAACLLGVIGAAIASFTSVSLLSGMGTVWFGVVVAAVGVVVAFAVRRVGVAVRVVACVLLVAAVGSAIYDEVQLQHRRDEISRLLNR